MPTDRKLATILAIDVAGFSRAMEKDDATAATSVMALRQAIADIASPLGGRIFNTAGDGFMLEFPAASSGVRAAVALLRESRNSAGRLPRIRIGLHMGEVVVAADGELFGQGVAVAAQLQTRAEPGTALVSEVVRQQVRTAAEAVFTPQGRVPLDKQRERVAVFALTSDGRKFLGQRTWARRVVAIAALSFVALGVALGVGLLSDREASSLSEPPLLAVVPFDGDPRGPQAVADNIAAEVLRDLSREGQNLRVLRHSSSFAFRGADKKLGELSRLLKATHVLDGQVTRNADQIVVTVELIDARTGQSIWRDRIESPVAELPKMTATVASRACAALQASCSIASPVQRIDPAALEAFITAPLEQDDMDVRSQREAVPLLERAVRLQPDFSRAWLRLAQAAAMIASLSADARESADARAAAANAAAKARLLAPDDVESWVVSGEIAGDAGDALSHARALDPLHPYLAGRDVRRLMDQGHGKAARDTAEQAFVLDPMNRNLRNLLVQSALLSDRADRADQIMRLYGERSASALWASIVVSWLWRRDWTRAELALTAMEEAVRGEAAASTDVTGRLLDDLRGGLAGLRQGVAAQQKAASRFDACTREPGSLPADVYSVCLPMLALLSGPEPAFSAWTARLDRLARSPGQAAEAEAWRTAWSAPVLGSLQRDPRFWELSARVDPRTGDGGPPDFCGAPGFPYDCRMAAASARPAENSGPHR